MIGLSISMCVKDVIEGRVAESDINLLVAGTDTKHGEKIDNLIAVYRENYWRTDPDAGEALCRRLYAYGLVVEPRAIWKEVLERAIKEQDESAWQRWNRVDADGNDVPNIASGYWLRSDEPEMRLKFGRDGVMKTHVTAHRF